jgi:hypothetical protein
MSDQKEQPEASATQVEPLWGVAANIVEERLYGKGGLETKRGTRKFHGGAKVYMVGAFWGMGGEKVVVVGHFRGKNPYITSVIGAELVENFRPELIYSPMIIEKILKPHYSVIHPHPTHYEQPQPISKEEAEQIAATYTSLAQWWHVFYQKKRDARQAASPDIDPKVDSTDDS